MIILPSVDKDQLIADLLKQNEELRRQVLTDELTQLGNFRKFTATYEILWKLALRNGESIAIAFFDLDHFKQINSEVGHAEANRILKAIAELAKEQIRDSDVLCRYGGDEFVAILPSANSDSCYQIAERIRSSVEQGFKYFDYTISCGIASCIPQAENIQEERKMLLKYACLNLQQAKQHGKNQVWG